MKIALALISSVVIFISGCNTKDKQSDASRRNSEKAVKVALLALSDSVRANGIVGWIPFLDTSRDFQWESMGSTLSYDSIAANFRRKNGDVKSLSLTWDTVHIQSLSEKEVTLFAIFTAGEKIPSGKQLAIAFNLKADLRLIDGFWKIHTCSIWEYEEPHTSLKVAEADTSRRIHQSMDSLIEQQCGPLSEAAAILDVDDRTANAAYRIYQDMGYIFEDPNRQLEYSYIVTIAKYEGDQHTLCDSGSIAIIRQNKIVWISKPLIHHFGFARIPGFGDFNNDGTTDILFSAQTDMRGYGEALWILSPDSSGGRLLNEVDEDKQSTIAGPASCFEILQAKGELAKSIEVDNWDKGKSIYFWNGQAFAKRVAHKATRMK